MRLGGQIEEECEIKTDRDNDREKGWRRKTVKGIIGGDGGQKKRVQPLYLNYQALLWQAYNCPHIGCQATLSAVRLMTNQLASIACARRGLQAETGGGWHDSLWWLARFPCLPSVTQAARRSLSVCGWKGHLSRLCQFISQQELSSHHPWNGIGLRKWSLSLSLPLSLSNSVCSFVIFPLPQI